MQKLNIGPQDYCRIYFVGFWETPARRCAAKKKGAWYANYFINMQKKVLSFLQKKMQQVITKVVHKLYNICY